jgi:hypothetical protein
MEAALVRARVCYAGRDVCKGAGAVNYRDVILEGTQLPIWTTMFSLTNELMIYIQLTELKQC